MAATIVMYILWGSAGVFTVTALARALRAPHPLIVSRNARRHERSVTGDLPARRLMASVGGVIGQQRTAGEPASAQPGRNR